MQRFPQRPRSYDFNVGQSLLPQAGKRVTNTVRSSHGGGLPLFLGDLRNTAKQGGWWNRLSPNERRIANDGYAIMAGNNAARRAAISRMSSYRRKSQGGFNDLVRGLGRKYRRGTGTSPAWDFYAQNAASYPQLQSYFPSMGGAVLRHARRAGQPVTASGMRIPFSTVAQLPDRFKRQARQFEWTQEKARRHAQRNPQQFANLGQRLMSVLRRGGDVGGLAKEFLGKAFKQFLGTSGGIRSA